MDITELDLEQSPTPNKSCKIFFKIKNLQTLARPFNFEEGQDSFRPKNLDEISEP